MTTGNQPEEILNYIKENPGASTEDIVNGTGWNRHLVEVATKMMVEQGLIRKTGKEEWGDSKFEIDLGHAHHARAIGTWPLMEKELEAVIAYADFDRITKQLSERVNTSSLKNFDPSPFQKAATAMSGLSFAFAGSPFSGFISSAIDRAQLAVRIAVIANVTPEEVRDFYQAHNYSLEFIEAAVRAGAKLDEEDIKRTMEEGHLTWDGVHFGITSEPTDVAFSKATAPIEQDQYTFLVILPGNDRREVQAAYMEVDGGCLYFEDDNRETILAFGPGHWVWAERVEDSEEST